MDIAFSALDLQQFTSRARLARLSKRDTAARFSLSPFSPNHAEYNCKAHITALDDKQTKDLSFDESKQNTCIVSSLPGEKNVCWTSLHFNPLGVWWQFHSQGLGHLLHLDHPDTDLLHRHLPKVGSRSGIPISGPNIFNRVEIWSGTNLSQYKRPARARHHVCWEDDLPSQGTRFMSESTTDSKQWGFIRYRQLIFPQNYSSGPNWYWPLSPYFQDIILCPPIPKTVLVPRPGDPGVTLVPNITNCAFFVAPITYQTMWLETTIIFSSSVRATRYNR